MNDDQKTHKNPSLRGQTTAPVRTGPKPFEANPRPAAAATPTRKLPPVLELDGKKWKVVSYRLTLPWCLLYEAIRVLIQAKSVLPSLNASLVTFLWLLALIKDA